LAVPLQQREGMRLRTILCPTDFSPGSLQAMRTAARLAKETGAELRLVHAWYVPRMTLGNELALTAQVVDGLCEEADRCLASARAQAIELGVPSVETEMLTGEPWHEIVHAIEKDPTIDLVVIGTHGRTGISRFLLGSVAEKVIRHAPCSVLAVRPDSEPHAYRHALCPVDFTPSSREAVRLASQLVARDKGEIALLHVIDLPVAHTGEPMSAGFVQDLDRDAAKHLAAHAAELQRETTIPIRARTRIGRPGTETLAALDADPTFDLVVMGSHGRTGIRRLLLGSVAEKVVRHARCPVLVARSRAEPH
jgi:nucleotide-binding universal stress UspA family protein